VDGNGHAFMAGMGSHMYAGIDGSGCARMAGIQLRMTVDKGCGILQAVK
jgi:hypothetical protein